MEEETIADFHVRILEIANESFLLVKKIYEEKLVWKIINSLPKRFSMKVTTIEEANDISTMKMNELLESLHTFELTIDENTNKMSKGLALHTISNE